MSWTYIGGTMSHARWCAAIPIVLLAIPESSAAQADQQDRYVRERRAMVALISARGIEDRATLAAMSAVPRHEYVPSEYRQRAYGDHPLPIGHGQTISQPYIVAYMTEILEPYPGMKVLEVGTGSGYQASVLAQIGCNVYTVEIFKVLADAAFPYPVRSEPT